MTSPGSSTTQMSPASRRSSWQIRQRSSSARLKQTWQSPIRSLTSRMASARAVASSVSARRMWNASRCAVRCPIPGSLPSSVIRRWTGGAYKPGSEPQAERAQVHAAREPAELRLLELLGGAQALVDRGEHHVLEQLGVVGIDRVRGDRDRLDHEVAGHLDLPHPAAGGGVGLLVLERLLGLEHVLLHLLDLLHHLLHVRGLRHLALPFLFLVWTGDDLLGIELCHEARDDLVLRGRRRRLVLELAQLKGDRDRPAGRPPPRLPAGPAVLGGRRDPLVEALLGGEGDDELAVV